MTNDLDELVDVGALTEWLDAKVPELGDGPIETELIHGGTSNVIVSVRRGDQHVVLRRPPVVPPPNSERTILREARVLTALNATSVPHPHCFGWCADPAIIGAPFFVMEHLDGWAGELGDGHISHPPPFDEPRHEHGVAFAVADALVELGKVDYREIGLTDYGRPEGFLARQVDRWSSQLDSYAELYGHHRREMPGYERVEPWLRDNVPDAFTAGIIHGDVGTPNMLFAVDPPARVVALIDWELSTVGDPLIDLAWFCKHLRDEREPDVVPSSALYSSQNMPTRQELARHYSAGTDRSIDELDYYLVLAMFKSACILEYKVAQAAAGLLPAATGDFFAGVVLANIAEAAKLVDRYG